MCLAEPHEICGEENYGSVVWKKTPAGDMAAVPCPSDATGTDLRSQSSSALVSVLNAGHWPDFSERDGINPTFPDSCRPDPPQMHTGRRGSGLLGEPNSHQMCFQRIPGHPDHGKHHQPNTST